jgi:hypothetical protein
MNDYQRDDAWQRKMRDEFLVPFYRRNFHGNLLLDGRRFPLIVRCHDRW